MTLPPLREVIAAHRLSASKALGQNFLLDEQLLDRIARIPGDLLDKAVLEIGPGPGGLTRALLRAGARVTAIEMDRRCLPALAELAEAFPGRLRVVEGDALTLDHDALVGEPYAIVANLPYNVGTALLVRWLGGPRNDGEWPPRWTSLTLMFQQEVAGRIVAAPGTGAYGRLAVLAQWRAGARLALKVHRSAFTPPPKVMSAVVHVVPAAAPAGVSAVVLEKVTEAAFGQRRKMLRQSLKALPGALAALDRLGIDPQRRAETLAVAEFVALGAGAVVNQVVQLISNPSAGRHKARRIAALGKAFEDAGATVHYTPCGADPPPIREDTTHVCVAAGDGTVRHVAGAMARGGRQVPLSIYPLGTINLLAMEAGYPRRPGDFARMALSRDPSSPHYPVSIGQGHFFACAGVGPDAVAVARVSTRLKRAIGRLAYGVAFAGVFLGWPRHRIRLIIGDHEVDCEAFYVAKGRYYAGPWSFAPAARVHDPVLHVVALTKARRLDYARFALALVTGGDLTRLRNVRILTCTALRAEAAEPLPVQADGDVVCTLPVTMTVSETPLLFC